MSQPNNRNAVARVDSTALAHGTNFTPDQVDLIASQIAPGASMDELKLFIHVASSRGLDPFRKHIYAIKRWNSQERRETIAFQVSIDGFRLIAERTGKYAGQVGPFWCGQDGDWRDVWLGNDPPAAAKVGVIRTDFREPTWAVALYSTFVQTTKDGTPTKFWKDMPEHMLAKVAESQALRKAFPEDAGGIYSAEEMGQADTYSAGTVIDHDTGEVIDAPARAQSRQNRPGRAEVVEEVSEDALPRLLRVAGKAGITDAQLEGWAVSKGCATIGAVPPAALTSIADKIERNTEVAVGFFEKYTPTVDAADVIDIPAEAPTAVPMEIDGMDDLNAAADRDLAAARARA